MNQACRVRQRSTTVTKISRIFYVHCSVTPTGEADLQTMTKYTHKESIHWRELDVLRGLAAILMIVNHLGYKTLNSNQIDGSLLGSLVFIGSFAPVLFFFVTGVGYGIQSSQKKKTSHWYITLNKVVVLVLADLLMHWSEGRWLGLDFLGFIGLSSLVLEFLRSSRLPLTYCIAGFTAVSLMRYLLGPYIRFLGYDQQTWGLIGWILGTSGSPGISYALSPWLAYPFAGYLIGVAAMYYRVLIETHRLQVISGLLMLAVFPCIAGTIMAQHGASFFRWGTVALGFYIVSFAVLLIGLAWSLAICGECRLRGCQNILSLKGIASLAVVPVHYFLIYLVVIIGMTGLSLFSFCVIAIAVLTTSFLLARSIEKLSRMIHQIKKQNVVWFVLVTMFLLAAGATLFFGKESTYLVMLVRTLGQIVLCLLLVIRWF